MSRYMHTSKEAPCNAKCSHVGHSKRAAERAASTAVRSSWLHASLFGLVPACVEGVYGLRAGKVRVMVSGASPLSPEVMDFLRICFPGALVVEGYGMTESACTIAVSATGDTVAGNVGGPIRCNEVKLADVPEMDYTNADEPYPRGEVGPVTACLHAFLGSMGGRTVTACMHA